MDPLMILCSHGFTLPPSAPSSLAHLPYPHLPISKHIADTYVPRMADLNISFCFGSLASHSRFALLVSRFSSRSCILAPDLVITVLAVYVVDFVSACLIPIFASYSLPLYLQHTWPRHWACTYYLHSVDTTAQSAAPQVFIYQHCISSS
ncbi:hypothetical protein DENSPDRAFT_832518 [Dentipellis sp. KUC8613]|nr:hypothetical protein DENSPDRAFT_832518 [Dentipellis sp. KUC8613]